MEATLEILKDAVRPQSLVVGGWLDPGDGWKPLERVQSPPPHQSLSPWGRLPRGWGYRLCSPVGSRDSGTLKGWG